MPEGLPVVPPVAHCADLSLAASAAVLAVCASVFDWAALDADVAAVEALALASLAFVDAVVADAAASIAFVEAADAAVEASFAFVVAVEADVDAFKALLAACSE